MMGATPDWPNDLITDIDSTIHQHCGDDGTNDEHNNWVHDLANAIVALLSDTPDPETPPGFWLGPIVDGVQTYGAYLRDIPAEGWVVRTDDGPIWTDAAGVATDDSVWVQARRRPAPTPTTLRWTVGRNNIGTPNEVHGPGHRIRIAGPLAVPIAERVAAALNAADPGPDDSAPERTT